MRKEENYYQDMQPMIYEMGRRAARAFVKQTFNPFAARNRFYVEWNRGWREGKRQLTTGLNRKQVQEINKKYETKPPQA